jgi:hypothetical protein
MDHNPTKKNSLKSRIGFFLIIAFFAASAIYDRRQDIQKFFASMSVSSRLKPYEQQVKKCLAEEET